MPSRKGKSIVGVSKKFIESHDMFGYQINFNFNGDGNSHNTLFGGFLSLFIKIGALAFFCSNLDRMINHKFNTQYVESGYLDLKAKGNVNYNDTGLKYFWNIYKLLGSKSHWGDLNGTLRLGDELDRYLNISFRE
jgi:hypothetical protein